MWLQSPHISCIHGFSTRHGGFSDAAFNSLNLGGSDDDQNKIGENRKKALLYFNIPATELCELNQIHSNTVCIAQPGKQRGDALVTDKKNLALVVHAADCYPILFVDAKAGVIAAAHSGWKGTLNRISGETVKAMLKLGAQTENIQVAIGPGISQENYEVSDEVIQKFSEAGFPKQCWNGRQLNLGACIVENLLEERLLPEKIWSINRCTFEEDFYSYRRDKGNTGRMWGLIYQR